MGATVFAYIDPSNPEKLLYQLEDPDKDKIEVNSGKFFLPYSTSKAPTNLIETDLFDNHLSFNENFTDWSQMFYKATDYNNDTYIPNRVTTLSSAFSECTKFNSNVSFVSDSHVTDLSYMFQNCIIYNKPITIPESATSCYGMFNRCLMFNTYVDIPEKVLDTRYMFRNCTSFNQPIYIKEGTAYLNYMFYDAIKMRSNVYIFKQSTVKYIGGFLFNSTQDASMRINIHCQDISLLTGTNASTSVTGRAISWTSMINGYYNMAQKVYIYSNGPWDSDWQEEIPEQFK